MFVIGTAGHVDHGKSTLVKALTGIDPDRLLEEKKRQMTIDLGFAWLTLPNGLKVGIVDVPGHRDFIENTLAGIGGIDAVLLVIAADEGVMPQTREHLSIIDLLKIKYGIIVLTKVDLVKDSEWLDLMEDEIRQLASGTILENAPIIRISSINGSGIQDLKNQISLTLAEIKPRVESSTPRLPIDRVFSISGFGTVVTGTLISGVFRIGDNVEIQPSGSKARIRGIQTYQKGELKALPGNRAAINLSGINVDQIDRGDVLTLPGRILPTFRIDCFMEVLKDASIGIKHNEFFKVFTGTSERIGRVRVLQETMIAPGETGYVQFEFTKPVVVMEDDRYIFRRISPAETLGGGQVLDISPSGRYKLNDSLALNRLKSRIGSSSQEKLFHFIDKQDYVFYNSLPDSFQSVDQLTLDQQLKVLEEAGKVIEFKTKQGEKAFFTNSSWERLTEKMQGCIASYHRQHSLLPGIPKAALRAKLNLPQNLIDVCTEKWVAGAEICLNNGFFALPTFSIKYSPTLEKRIHELTRVLDTNPYNPPPMSAVTEALGDELFESLVCRGILIQVSPEVVFRVNDYENMLAYVIKTCREIETLEIQDFKEKFKTTRKFALAFLEHLDSKGITRREGDVRKLISIPPGFPNSQNSY